MKLGWSSSVQELRTALIFREHPTPNFQHKPALSLPSTSEARQEESAFRYSDQRQVAQEGQGRHKRRAQSIMISDSQSGRCALFGCVRSLGMRWIKFKNTAAECL
jgi:hypothetical protein